MSESREPVGDSATSRLLHVLQTLSSKTAAAGLAAMFSVIALLWALASHNSQSVLTWFEGLASAVTLVMVFTLQHTQTRQQVALQRKLDEILHALPDADSGLIGLESAPSEAIHAVEQRHTEIRDSVGSTTAAGNDAETGRKPPTRPRGIARPGRS